MAQNDTPKAAKAAPYKAGGPYPATKQTPYPVGVSNQTKYQQGSPKATKYKRGAPKGG